jgi:hypothetical protein
MVHGLRLFFAIALFLRLQPLIIGMASRQPFSVIAPL